MTCIGRVFLVSHTLITLILGSLLIACSAYLLSIESSTAAKAALAVSIFIFLCGMMGTPLKGMFCGLGKAVQVAFLAVEATFLLVVSFTVLCAPDSFVSFMYDTMNPSIDNSGNLASAYVFIRDNMAMIQGVVTAYTIITIFAILFLICSSNKVK